MDELDDLFLGHVEETDYGLFAEDSPSVSSAFVDGDACYVYDDEMKSVLSEYSDIIDTVIYVYANDTSGKRKEEELQL